MGERLKFSYCSILRRKRFLIFPYDSPRCYIMIIDQLSVVFAFSAIRKVLAKPPGLTKLFQAGSLDTLAFERNRG